MLNNRTGHFEQEQRELADQLEAANAEQLKLAMSAMVGFLAGLGVRTATPTK